MNGLLVVDASAVVATLLEGDERGQAAAAHMRGRGLVAPDLIGYEVLNALRRRRAAGALTATAAERAVEVWRSAPIEMWSLENVIERLWALTGAMSSYDAAYVALAERLDVPLLTADRRLAHAPGITADVIVI